MSFDILCFSAAFVPPHVGRSLSHATVVASIETPNHVVAADGVAAKRLWGSAGKPLLRIGSKGAAPSHANGLTDLCSAHPYVCVKFSGTGVDASLSQLLDLIQLASPPVESTPMLLTTRKGRRGGLEALFSQKERLEQVCSAEFHDEVREARLLKKIEDQKWAAVRAARDADKVGASGVSPTVAVA